MQQHAGSSFLLDPRSKYRLGDGENGPDKITKPKDPLLMEKNKALIEASRRKGKSSQSKKFMRYPY